MIWCLVSMHIGIGFGQSLNEPVFYLKISHAAFETPLTTVFAIDTNTRYEVRQRAAKDIAMCLR